MRQRSGNKWLLIWALSFSSMAMAQTDTVSRFYSMRDGLPDQGVICVMQDSKGFIWVGTYSGLCRFDGISFECYRNNPRTSNSLTSNIIYGIIEDNNSRLWIAHAQGIDVFDTRTESFQIFWPRSPVFTKTRDGRILIADKNGGIFLADPQTMKAKMVDSLKTDFRQIAETKNGSIVCASDDDGIYFKNASDRTFTHFTNDPKDEKSIGPYKCIAAFVDSKDRVWIGTHSGLELFDPLTETFKHFALPGPVLTFAEHPGGVLLIGTSAGLYAFDPSIEKISSKVPDHHLSSLIRDRQGNIWTASLKGLRRLQFNTQKFRLDKRFGKNVGYIIEDRDSNIWISSYEVGTKQDDLTVFKFNRQDNAVFKYTLHSPATSLAFGGIYLDDRGEVCITHERNTLRYDRKSSAFETIESTASDLSPLSILRDSQGKVWIGTWSDVFSFDIRRPTITRNKELTTDMVHAMIEDSKHNLWIGTQTGLIRHKIRDKQTDKFNTELNRPSSLPGNSVYSLAIDTRGNLWLGTSNGICRMIKGSEASVPQFEIWSTQNSDLPNDDVYCVVDGGDGTFWAACGDMITHFDPTQNTFENYDSDDGLGGGVFKGMGFNSAKGMRAKDGSIYFGSLDGTTIFHPDSLKKNIFIPPVEITSLSVRDRRLRVDTSTFLQKSDTTNQALQLTHDQNDFNIRFAALNYIDAERNRYKYKLIPYEKDWIETDANTRFARYTNISPGDYTFQVIASNNDGVWNTKGAAMHIIIAPPWWLTWWAYCIYFALGALCIFAWRAFENNRVRIVQRAEYLSELDEVKTRFFHNISHEFRTPITLILGPLKDMFRNSEGKIDRSLLSTMIRNGDRLLRLINQLLDLSKLDVGRMKLHKSPVAMVSLLRDVVASYETLAAEKKILLMCSADTNEIIANVDLEKIENSIHNILSNALKFTPPNGNIVVYLKSDKTSFEVSVTDTGIGIPPDQIDKIFDRFYQVDNSHTQPHGGSGLGMALTKEIVNLHGGSIKVQSDLGKGTTFRVTIPIGKPDLFQNTTTVPQRVREQYEVGEEIKLHSPAIISRDTSPIMTSNEMKSILIIDDNVDMRRYLHKILSEQYHIVEAPNGAAGAKIAAEVVPDLIISDIMMPEMDGMKLCEVIKTKELTSHIPILLLTAKADRDSKLAGLDIGADDYLLKPFDSQELKLIIRNRIEARNKMKERFSREVTLEPQHIVISSFDEKFIQKVLKTIEDHMDDENFSIDQLSQEVGYSNMHLYRKLKALAGQSPSQFVRTIRLKRAAELLANASDNVTQIAFSVGFSSVPYFNKCFKDQFGVTPGKYLQTKDKD